MNPFSKKKKKKKTSSTESTLVLQKAPCPIERIAKYSTVHSAPRASVPVLSTRSSVSSELQLDFGDGLSGVEAFGACAGAVENGMAAEEAEFILELLLSLGAICVPGVRNPSVGLHQSGRPKVLVLIPPITRTTRRAACTQDTLVHSIELPAILLRL